MKIFVYKQEHNVETLLEGAIKASKNGTSFTVQGGREYSPQEVQQLILWDNVSKVLAAKIEAKLRTSLIKQGMPSAYLYAQMSKAESDWVAKVWKKVEALDFKDENPDIEALVA